MALKLYNSMGRKLQTFRPLKEGEVRLYTCGPTVWNYAHIGNYRTFVFEDVLRRYLKFKGFKVTQVRNITDVEDRIIMGIKQFNKSRLELTTFYEQAFMEDLSTLGVEPAEKYPRATENLGAMVQLVESLMDKGYAYKAEDGSIYFDVSKFKSYGRLSGVKIGTGKGTGRVAQDHYEEKKRAVDFALWKAWDPDDGEVFWETDLGKGRPGWHIECSAMSMKYLGESFDIHTGGLDLRFPHHENEIAQSEGATGKKFVNYWLHAGFLFTEGEEMHKSIGNVVYLRDLVARGWEPKVIRLFLISGKYRDSLDLTEKKLQQAKAETQRLQDLVLRLKRAEGDEDAGANLGTRLLERFENAMDDDLNTPKAFASIFEVLKEANALFDSNKLGKEGASELLEALEKVDGVLGILRFKEDALPARFAAMIAAREGARKRHDFVAADKIRAQLLSEGIVLEDSPRGTSWKRRAAG